jgi:hypothetical protein
MAKHHNPKHLKGNALPQGIKPGQYTKRGQAGGSEIKKVHKKK